MKIGINRLVAVALVTIILASAQYATSQNCPPDAETVATLAQDYAGRVDGLLRNVHAALQEISERVESGSLTPQQAQKLKFAATREMIARLETLSAVYDAKLDLKDMCKHDTRSAAYNASSTVSVGELRRETDK